MPKYRLEQAVTEKYEAEVEAEAEEAAKRMGKYPHSVKWTCVGSRQSSEITAREIVPFKYRDHVTLTADILSCINPGDEGLIMVQDNDQALVSWRNGDYDWVAVDCLKPWLAKTSKWSSVEVADGEDS